MDTQNLVVQVKSYNRTCMTRGQTSVGSNNEGLCGRQISLASCPRMRDR